jgi:branched-chain amino acid transport system substrate-binding protein
VAAFEAEYGYVPALYASQGYDAALLIDSAVRAVDGDLSDKEALMEAMRRADFDSVRGNFSFNTNQFPVQDFYLVRAIRREDGSYATTALERIFEGHADRQAEECPM